VPLPGSGELPQLLMPSCRHLPRRAVARQAFVSDHSQRIRPPGHPATRAQFGTDFDRAIGALRYGGIGINAWVGAAFLLPRAAWGAYPEHTYTDVQSGIGVVHNALMFDKPLKTVVSAPFRPFPRSVRHGELTMFPKPPWFLTNKTSEPPRGNSPNSPLPRPRANCQPSSPQHSEAAPRPRRPHRGREPSLRYLRHFGAAVLDGVLVVRMP